MFEDATICSDLEKLQKLLMGITWFFDAIRNHPLAISTKRKHKILRNLDLKLSMKIWDQKLAFVDTAIYLGMQMNNSLDWK